MSKPRAICASAAALLMACLVGGSAEAGPYRAPRTAAGQPDLQGTWTGVSLTDLEREPQTPLTFANLAEEQAYEARTIAAWAHDEADGLGQGVSESAPQISHGPYRRSPANLLDRQPR